MEPDSRAFYLDFHFFIGSSALGAALILCAVVANEAEHGIAEGIVDLPPFQVSHRRWKLNGDELVATSSVLCYDGSGFFGGHFQACFCIVPSDNVLCPNVLLVHGQGDFVAS